MFIRQAHPGPGARAYRSFDEKLEDARRYVREERIPWTVLVDDLEGTVHQGYGGLADPSYLIGADGRVSYYELWTHAPTLHRKMEALVAQGGRGIVDDGIDRVPHLLAALTDGWDAIEKGLPQSYIDLERAAPGSASLTWLGHRFRPLLAPLTLRGEPLPAAARLGLAVGLAALGAAALRLARRAT
ncbi:MAG TPA: hypothetical protein VF158_09110 [Longimicrobiales bacterium]